MAAIAELNVSLVLTGTEGSLQLVHEPPPFRWSPLVGKRESVSLTGGVFTALSPPANSKAVIIVLPITAAALSLKSVTGDGGIALVPVSNFIGLPIVLPLGATPSIGLLNAGATCAIDVIWL